MGSEEAAQLGAGTPGPGEDKVRRRLAAYERTVRLTRGVGAGLLAEVTIFASLQRGAGAESTASTLVGALFVTVFFAASACLLVVMGWVEWQKDILQRLLAQATPPLTDETSISEARQRDDKENLAVAWVWYQNCYTVALRLTVAAALLLLTKAWVQVVCAPPSPPAAPSPTGTPTPDVPRPVTPSPAARVNLTRLVLQASTSAGATTDPLRESAHGIASELFKSMASKLGEKAVDALFEIGSPEQVPRPAAPQVSAQTILFELAKADVSPSDSQRLAELARTNDATGCRFEIRGFADCVGNARANLWLSWRRASAAGAVLIAAGVDPWLINVVARGDTDAQASASPEDRRVVVRRTCTPQQ